MDGFEEQLKRWQQKAIDAYGILESIKPKSREEMVTEQSPWQATTALSPLQKLLSWFMRASYPMHYEQKTGALIPGLPGPEAEQVKKEVEAGSTLAETKAISDYEESTWFLNVYSATPTDFTKANITSFDEYLERFPPEPQTDPADIAAAKEYAETYLLPGTKTPVDLAPEDYAAAKEFIVSPLETRPQFKGIHLTTVEEMVKWLQKEVELPELAEEEKGQLLEVLKSESGLTDEELAEIEASTSDWTAKMEEYQQDREQIKRYKLGLETPNMPAMSIGDRMKLFGSQPALALMDAMQPFWTYWNFPEAAIVTRGAMSIGKYFPKLSSKESKEAEEEMKSELDSLYQKNREAGMGFWMAHSKAWQDWELSQWGKMGLEIVLDPVSYLGFGLLIKAAKATKGVPVIGKIFGGLGAFERGFITATEAPFTAVKGWMKAIPKTTGQRATKSGAFTRDSIFAIHGKNASRLGKTMEQITLDEFTSLNEKAISHTLANPDAIDDLAQLGRAYIKRDVLTHDDLAGLASRVGSKLKPDDITQGMVEAFEHIVEHTNVKGSKFRVYKLKEAAQKLLKDVLEVAETPAKMKIVKDFITELYSDAITKGRHIATELPMVDSIDQAASLAEKAIFTEAKEGLYFKRLHGGFTAAIMNNAIDPFVTQIWRNWIDKKIIMPFARAYLITGSYAPWNWAEEVGRTIFGRGGTIYGKNTPAELEALTLGLMFDRTVLQGASLAKESYKNILKKRLLRPGAEIGIGEISQSALLKELEADVGKPMLEKILMLGWLPGQKGRAIHEAMYFPIRASQWSGGMQRSGYVTSKWLENLNDIAGDTMKSIHNAMPPTTLDGVAGLPSKTKKAFAKGLEQRGLVGPEAVRNYPKNFSVRNIHASEVHEARLKYPDLGVVGDMAEEAAYSGRLWDDVGGFIESAWDKEIDDVLATPEAKAKFMEKFVDDALGSVERVQDADTLLAFAKYLQSISTDLPETTSALFVGLQHKGAKARNRIIRAQIYDEGYQRIAPFLDTGDAQARRLLEFIHENMDVLTVAQANELEKNLSIYMSRVEALTNTRRKAMARSRELLEEGIKPGTPTWYEETDRIWQEHFKITDPELFSLQRAAAKDLDVAMGMKDIPKPIINASGRTLTPMDVASLHYATGNDLAYAIMNSEALMPKPYFVKSTAVEAIDMARRAGTTREALGFTDDAIGGVYDQIVHGLRSDPAIHDVLTVRRMQLDNFAMDLESIRINGSISSDTTKVVQNMADDFANNLEKLDIYAKPIGGWEPMYRGSLAPKDILGGGDFPGVFLSTKKEYAAQYGAIKEYYVVQGQRLLDLDDIVVKELIGEFSKKYPKVINLIDNLPDDLFLFPNDEWVKFLRSKGYTGTSIGSDRFIFNPKDVLTTKPTIPTHLGEGSSDWWRIKQEAMDKAMVSYHQDFTDYTNLNALDAFMRHIFPYWTYESQRWFWLPRNFVTHPGVLNTWGKYMNNSDYGYIHMPGTSLDVNIMRGTVYKGGMSTLVRRDYPDYYDEAFPELFESVDYAQRLGFFPNIFYGFLTSEFGGRQPQRGQLLPAIVRTPLDLFVAAHPGSEAARQIQDRLFPDYFRQYSQICQATHLATDDQIRRGINGVFIWEKMQRNDPLTPEESELWNQARQKVAALGPLMEHGGIYRLRHEDRTEAYELFGKYIEEITGISPDMQKKLRMHGMSVGDIVGGLSQMDMLQIEEALEYQRWISPRVTASLRPSNEQEVNLILSEFWTMVKQHNDDNMDRLEELEAQAFAGQGGWISREEYVESVRSIMSDNASYIHELRGDTYDPATGTYSQNPNAKTKFRNVPVTLEERSAFYAERGVILTMSTFDEMLAMWYELSPKQVIDPETDRLYTDWSTYFATMDAIEGLMPPDLKSEWEAYMSRNRTPGWIRYKQATEEYLVPYWNVTNLIKEQFSPEEQALIDEYYLIKDIDPLRAQAIQDYTMPNGLKLLSQYRSRLSDARKKLRMSIPMVDAQLLYWGRTATLLTPKAEELYNQLVDEGQRLYG